MTESEKVLLVETEQRSRGNSRRIEKLEEQNTIIHHIATSVEVMAVEMKNLVSQMLEIKCGFSDMESKINTDISSVKQDVGNIGSKVDQMKAEIEDVRNQDHKQKAKKWDDIWSKLQWVVIGGLATYITSQFISAIL